ncbi:MAG: hypothetical protein M3505_07355 [Verrucomicrobiota bacterium]|nr:hypothetical protein [Verrucomicrobiota bacterium]
MPLFLLLLVALAVSAQAQTGGTWQLLAPMPTARQEFATAVLNGKIYVAGLGTEGNRLREWTF